MSLSDKLRELFLLDQQVRGLRSRLDSALKRLEIHQSRLAQLVRQRDELTGQYRVIRTKAMTLELQTKEADERVIKLREQMNNVKTNKEYSALLVEVNTLKADKSKVEDQALGELSKADELDKQVKEFEGKITEQQQMVQLAEKEVEECKTEVGSRLDSLTAERDTAMSELPADAKQQFQRSAQLHDGDGMAAVIEESRRHKEYTCGGCYIGLPVERVNTLMVSDQIVICPSCGRILYIEEVLKTSMKSK